MSYTLIDPPITPYSKVLEIKEWLIALSKMEQNKQVKEEIRRTEELLNNAKKRQ